MPTDCLTSARIAGGLRYSKKCNLCQIWLTFYQWDSCISGYKVYRKKHPDNSEKYINNRETIYETGLLQATSVYVQT